METSIERLGKEIARRDNRNLLVLITIAGLIVAALALLLAFSQHARVEVTDAPNVVVQDIMERFQAVWTD